MNVPANEPPGAAAPTATPAAAAEAPAPRAEAPKVDAQKIDRQVLDDALNAMNSLLRTFGVERYVHLATAAAASALLFYATYKMITTQQIGGDLGLIFGASGLATVATTRSAYFFRRAFDLIEKIVSKLAGV